MKLWFSHIRVSIPMVMFCLGLTSCIYEDGTEPDTTGNSSDLMVSFTLRLERGRDGSEAARSLSMIASRASDYDGSQTWGTIIPTDPGNIFDNRLLKEHFHMLLLDKGTNKVVGKMESDNMNVLIYDPNDEYTIMQFWGVLDTELSITELDSDDKYKVMIFANGNACSIGLGEVFSGPGMSFSHIGQPGNIYSSGKSFDAIPMWGVAEAKLKGIKPGERQNIGEVSMLRSMAKIIVDVDADENGDLKEEVKGVKLTALTVTHCNTNGEMLPKGWNTVTDTKNLSIKNTLHIPVSPAPVTDFGKSFVVNETDKGVTSFEFYVPEYDNSIVAEFLLKVKYSVDGSEEKEGEIHICKYEEGQPITGYALWPIVRNHIYHYTITSAGPTMDALRFNVSIADMENGGEFNYEYDFDI